MPLLFPFDVLAAPVIGRHAPLVERFRQWSLTPPYPWGQILYARLFEKTVPLEDGDIIECGVGRGGMSFFLAELSRRYCRSAKRVWALDSFVGLPEPDRTHDSPYFLMNDYQADRSDRSLFLEFKTATERFGLDDVIMPVEGFFKDTFPSLPPDIRFCFVHIDADLYASVAEALDYLYDRLLPGGAVVIDDFFHPSQGPKRAASDFFNRRGITPLYHVVFPYSAFIIKDESYATTSHPRAWDGNRYSLHYLKELPELREAVRESLARQVADTRSLTNARILYRVLRTSTEHPHDIYDYWHALESFWEILGMDRTPEQRILL